MADSLTSHSLTTLREMLETKQCSARELVDAYLAEIDTKNETLNAYLEVFTEEVRNAASAADTARARGEGGTLCGIPLGIKDNILLAGHTASAASRMLEHYRATYDATAVTRLKEAGALFLGRTNMDEFAMGSSTEHSAFGVTKNPHDATRVPGGSSGGSAAAVAANLAPAALGSDTGGSIRQPASFCGVVGLKPTYGSVSRHGLMAMGSSLDVIGPLTKTVADAELLYEVIRGNDRMDATTLPDERTRIEPKSHYTIGVPHSFLAEGVDAAVLEVFERSLQSLRDAGHTVVEVEVPTLAQALAAYYIIMPAEVSANLARFDGMRYGLHVDGKDGIDDYRVSRGAGFGREVRRRILLGTYVLSSGYYDAYYGTALSARNKIRAAVAAVFETVDALATPTAPTPAFRIGEKTNDPLSMYLADIYTVSANMLGVPAISVPAGTVSADGVALPVGFQLMAPALGEATLFSLGKVLTGETA